MKKKPLLLIVVMLLAVLIMALAACVDGNPETDNDIPNPPENSISNPPKYIGFKYDTQSIQAQSYQIATLAYGGVNGNAQVLASDGNEDYKDSQGNYGEALEQRQDTTLVLIYENAQRDTILDILIDDSIEGINRVYTTSSDVNKILKIDTVFNVERNIYISEVHLFIKGTTIAGNRTIEIKETSFLREAISGKAIVDPSAKKTVNFQVTDKERKVTFDLQRDDGKYNSYEWNGNVGKIIVKLGETYGELPSCFMSETFCEEYYYFAGWWTEENGGGIQITYESIVEIADEQTLYAKWVFVPTRQLIYDGNGSTGGSLGFEIPVGGFWSPVGDNSGAYIAINSEFTKEGYELVGWNTERDGSGVDYAFRDTIHIPEGDTPFVIYAQWKRISKTLVSLSFDGNGNTGGTTSSIWMAEGSEYILPECGFTKEGYEFIGWNTESDGSGDSYAARDLFSVPWDIASVEFYAQWLEIYKVITFDLQRDDCDFNLFDWQGDLGTITVEIGKEYGELPEGNYEYIYDGTAKGSYKFAGWWTEKSGGIQITSESIVEITHEQTLYAKWVHVPARWLVYDENGGVLVGGGDVTLADLGWWALVGTEVPIWNYDVERLGYRFIGWNTESDGSGDNYTSDTPCVLPEGDTPLILYAQWELI